MNSFDIAPDGEQVAYSVGDNEVNFHAWVAPLDNRTPPKLLVESPALIATIGSRGEIYLLRNEGKRTVVTTSGPGNAPPQTILDGPALWLAGISPRGDAWFSLSTSVEGHLLRGGAPVPICGACAAAWGPGGTYFYLRFRDLGELGGGTTIAMSVPPGAEFPNLPPGGFKSAGDTGANVVSKIDMKDKIVFSPGPNPSIYAYVRATVQRNLYRIPLN